MTRLLKASWCRWDDIEPTESSDLPAGNPKDVQGGAHHGRTSHLQEVDGLNVRRHRMPPVPVWDSQWCLNSGSRSVRAWPRQKAGFKAREWKDSRRGLCPAATGYSA